MEFLTVGKLKELLEKVPDEVFVMSKGCDCSGLAGGISEVYNDSLFENNEYKRVKAIEIQRAPGQ